MRAGTANRILLWIVAAVAFAAVLAIAGGDPQARELAGGAVVLTIVVGGMTWLSRRFRVEPRRDSFADQAEAAGLRAEPGDPLGLLDTSFAIFARAATVRDVENTAVGMRDGLETVVADSWFAPSSNLQRDDYLRYVCVLTPTPTWWPDVVVLTADLAARVRSALAMPDVEMELEGFNRRFEVHATDARFAHALLDARFMEWLLAQPLDVGFEVHAGRLLVHRRRATASLDDVAVALETSDELRSRIPRVVLGDPI